MKINQFEFNKPISENNNFSEYKSFKAENYFNVEKHDFAEDFIIDESFENNTNDNKKREQLHDNINKDSKSKLKQIEKISNTAQNISQSIATHSSVVLTTTVAIVSATLVGAIPSINFFNDNETKIIQESIVTSPSINKILVEGIIANVDSNHRYFALVDQYINEEKIEIDDVYDLYFENNHFYFNASIFYGITSYQYDIFIMKKKEESLLLYSSKKLDYNIDQSYNATYTKVEPKDAKYTFNDDGSVTAHIETNFKTNFDDVYKYGINILDKEGNVIDKYIGSNSSVDLTITNNDIGTIYFQYIDIGEFFGEYHEYDNYMATDYSVIKIPIISLSENVEFDGEHFVLSLNTSTIYDSISVDLELTSSNNKINKHIEQVIEKVPIILDEFDGEIGKLEVTGKYNFKDESIDKYPHSINITPKQYDLNYKFDVTNIFVEAFDGGDYMPTTFHFNYLVPNSYKIKISDTANNIEETTNVTNELYLNSISSGDGANLKLEVLDELDNIWKTIGTYQILNSQEVNDAYVTPASTNSPNPGDSLVTYNDDGTINIYRNMMFKTNSSNTYYDAFIYNKEIEDTETRKKTYIDGHHNISNEQYSIIENIPEKDYYFHYFQVLKNNDVYYYVKKETPSGGIQVNDLINVSISGIYEESTNTTSININTYLTQDAINNKCNIDGVEYEIIKTDNGYALSIEGDAIGKEITISANMYFNNYDDFNSNIALKGNKYKTYKFTINN